MEMPIKTKSQKKKKVVKQIIEKIIALTPPEVVNALTIENNIYFPYWQLIVGKARPRGSAIDICLTQLLRMGNPDIVKLFMPLTKVKNHCRIVMLGKKKLKLNADCVNHVFDYMRSRPPSCAMQIKISGGKWPKALQMNFLDALDAIRKCEIDLTIVDMHGDDEFKFKLPGVLANCKLLESLTLDGAACSHDSLASLLTVLQQTKIRALKLLSMPFDESTVSMLADLLAKKKLVKLEIEDCPSIDGDGASTLFKAAAQCKTLQLICLSGATIDRARSKVIYDELLRSKRKTLQIFRLNSAFAETGFDDSSETLYSDVSEDSAPPV